MILFKLNEIWFKNKNRGHFISYAHIHTFVNKRVTIFESSLFNYFENSTAMFFKFFHREMSIIHTQCMFILNFFATFQNKWAGRCTIIAIWYREWTQSINSVNCMNIGYLSIIECWFWTLCQSVMLKSSFLF